MAYVAHYAGKIAGDRDRYLICRIEPTSEKFGRECHATHEDSTRGTPGPSVMAIEGDVDTLKRLMVVECVVAAMNGASLQIAKKPDGYHWASAGEGHNAKGPFSIHKANQARHPEASLIVLDSKDEGIQKMNLSEMFVYLCAMAGNTPEAAPSVSKLKRAHKKRRSGPPI